MCAQHEEGQRDGGVFPRGQRAHPINSLTLTQSCVTPNEINLSQVFFFFNQEKCRCGKKSFLPQTDVYLENDFKNTYNTDQDGNQHT